MRIRVWLGLAGMALIVAGAGTALAAPEANAADQAYVSSRALEVAKILMPEEAMLDQTERGFLASIGPSLAANTRLAQIEKDYPGAQAAMIKALVPEIRAIMKSGLPKVWQAVAQLLQRDMSPSEIDGTGQFYASKLGRKLQSLSVEETSITEIARAVQQLNGKAMPGHVVETAMSETAHKAVSRLSNEERLEIVKYSLTPSGIKMTALQSEMAQVMVSIPQEMMSKVGPNIFAVGQQAMQVHIEAMKKAKNSN